MSDDGMRDELKFPDADERLDRDSLGEPLESLIREAYTPPDAAAFPDMYWSGLETRIMARIAADNDRGWWSELMPWARIGLAAAAAIFALAGIINQRMEPREEVAYEAVIEPDMTTASDDPIAGQYLTGDNDGAALRYYLSN